MLSCNGKSATATENNVPDNDIVYNYVPEHDFSIVITGDTVYFNILEDKKTASLVYWGRTNLDNPVIEVPSHVSHQGIEYTVVEIGDEAMGVGDEGSMNSVWNSDANKVKRIVLPCSVKKVGNATFTGRFRDSDYTVQLTDSIEYLGEGAVNCMCIHDKNYAIILPANIRVVGWLQDNEDQKVNEEYDAPPYPKLYIPEHLEYIGGLENFYRNQPQFRKVEVHPGNKHFKAINGALYSYALDSIYWATVQENLYIPKELRVDKNSIDFLKEGWYLHLHMPVFETIVTEEGNPYCVAIDNVLYDKKNKCMIMAAVDESRTVHVPSWCKDIYTIYTVTGSFTNSMPRSYEFSANASKENVSSFINALNQDCENGIFSFTYKGKTWSSNQEMPDFK